MNFYSGFKLSVSIVNVVQPLHRFIIRLSCLFVLLLIFIKKTQPNKSTTKRFRLRSVLVAPLTVIYFILILILFLIFLSLLHLFFCWPVHSSQTARNENMQLSKVRREKTIDTNDFLSSSPTLEMIQSNFPCFFFFCFNFWRKTKANKNSWVFDHFFYFIQSNFLFYQNSKSSFLDGIRTRHLDGIFLAFGFSINAWTIYHTNRNDCM